MIVKILDYINNRPDKFLHLSFSALLVIIVFAIFSNVLKNDRYIYFLSIGIPFLLGCVKELYDMSKNNGDWYDMLYNVFGLIIGLILIKVL